MKFYAVAHFDFESAFIHDVFDVSTSLQFGTVLNGGYAECSFDVLLPVDVAAVRFRALLGNHIVVYDDMFRDIYEGKVVSVGMRGGVLSVACAGYFSQGNKKLIPMTVMELWNNPTVTDVLSACVNIMDDWSHLTIGLQGADLILSGFTGEDNIKVNEMIERCLKFGMYESSTQACYFAIYEGRLAQLIKSPLPVPALPQHPYWLVSNELNSDDGTASSISTDEVYNTVYLRYDDSSDDGVGPTLLETPLELGLSKFMYGEMEGIIDVGQYGLTLGQELQAIALERYSFPRKKMSFSIGGMIRSGSGAFEWPYMIRAGDTIVVTDFDVATTDWDYKVGNTTALVSQVMKTSYVAQSNTLSIDVASGDSTFEYYMSRLGLDGGLG